MRMFDESFESLEFRNLFKTLWSNEETARTHRMRAHKSDLSTLSYEACCLSYALNSSRPLVDKAARAGLCGYLDETRLIIAAMPATDVNSLRAKLAALGDLDPLVSAHRRLPAMLKAALREDLRRFPLPDPPAWFVKEQGDRKTQDNAGKRQRRQRKTRDRQFSDESNVMTSAVALQILGLEAGASTSDVRAAHQRLILKVHPDRGGSNYFAALVNAARDALLEEK